MNTWISLQVFMLLIRSPQPTAHGPHAAWRAFIPPAGYFCHHCLSYLAADSFRVHTTQRWDVCYILWLSSSQSRGRVLNLWPVSHYFSECIFKTIVQPSSGLRDSELASYLKSLRNISAPDDTCYLLVSKWIQRLLLHRDLLKYSLLLPVHALKAWTHFSQEPYLH